MSDPHFLTLDEVLRIHRYQIEAFGGADGVLNMELLESAIAQPRQGFGGTYFHPDLASMAAAYLFHIISNHAFRDGNKRTGVHAALVFLGLNGVDLELPVDESEKLALGVAAHTVEKDEVIAFFTRLIAAHAHGTGEAGADEAGADEAGADEAGADESERPHPR